MSGIFYKNRPYAGGGSGGGDTVEITPTLSAGTKVADYEINGISGALYAPTPATPPDDLNDLSDVAISSPTNGQVLKYNSTSGKWENGTGGGGGSYSETTLYTNSGTSRENIALSDSYSNYNQMYFECIRVADNRDYVVPYYMPISSLSTGHFQFFGYNEYISFDVTNATTFTLVNGDGSWYIKRVIGIKY